MAAAVLLPLLALLALAAGAVPPAHAQENRDEARTDEPADAGVDSAAVVLPALRAVVRRSLLDPGRARSIERLEPGDDLLPYADLSEWLASRAGVGVRGYGGGGRQVLSVRGTRAEGVLVLLDGIPLNDPLTGEADVSSVPLASLESATLVRGAGAARHGSGALGGALLLETGAGDAAPAARFGVGSHGAYEASASAGWRPGGEADAQGGPPDTRIGIEAGVRGADNDFRYEDRLAPGSPEVRRENADSRSRWIALVGRRGAGRVTLRADELERGVPGRLGTSLFAGDRWRETRWSATGGAAWPDAHVRAGFRRLAMRYEPADGPGPSAQTALDARVGGELVVPRLAGVVVGVRASAERLEGDGIAGDPDRLAAGLTVRRAVGLIGDDPGGTAAPGAGAALGLEPALALDVADGETAASPELGAWWRPGRALRVYGRIGRAYRLPTFADLHFEAAPGVRARADLRAERVVLDAELGAELAARAAGGRGSVHVAAWHRTTRRPIAWLASSAAIWSPRNLDRLSARGVEITAGFERAAGAALTWSVEAGLALQRSRVGFGTNRNPLPYQPDAMAHAAVELTRGATALRVGATYTGSRTTTLAATRRLGGFVTVDAGVRRRLEIGPVALVASAAVDNLLDRHYELVELFPEPGRTLRLALDVR